MMKSIFSSLWADPREKSEDGHGQQIAALLQLDFTSVLSTSRYSLCGKPL